MSEVGDLQVVLDALDVLVRDRRPELYPRFRPGVSARELDALAAGLEPYYLPAELVALYQWHDGWDSSRDGVHRSLLPEAEFNSLAETIAAYRGWQQALGSDGWHPLWFPAFGSQFGELVSLQLEPGRPAGQVYAFHSEEDLSTSSDSVAALFAAALDCWRRGLLPEDAAYPEIRTIAARHNPSSRKPSGESRHEISRSSTTDWPDSWKKALGIGPLVGAADEEVVRIADFEGDPSSGRPIRAELTGWGGSIDTLVATASDGTGSVKVLLTRSETENFRELVGGRRFDLWLVPTGEQTSVDELARAMSHIAVVPEVPYVARRIVPV